MNYPNMMSELLEAVHGYFEDYPDVETDIYLYLESLRSDLSRANRLANEVENILVENNRCPYCGTALSSRSHKEFHTELEGNPYEVVKEVYCPNCGMEV